MRTGTVTWFSDNKGYGFITDDDGGDVFVHHTSIMGNGFRTLEKGQVVEFEFVDGSKGPRAEKVVIVGRTLGGLT